MRLTAAATATAAGNAASLRLLVLLRCFSFFASARQAVPSACPSLSDEEDIERAGQARGGDACGGRRLRKLLLL